ncbi:MAG: diguanylate cyclase [Gammaproteobacteria bacterium WSBS_2016_MAG_OTU1]
MLSLLLAIMGVLTYLLFAQNTEWLKLEKERTDLRIKVDELRQSSNDLTRFIRLYALTPNKEYLDNYLEILNIRNGVSPRPLQYHHVYWDLPPEERAQRHPLGKKEALIDVFQSMELSPYDKRELADSLERSEELTVIEISVFSVFDEAENDEETKEAARQILFSPRYQKAKESIMLPIDNVLSNVESQYITETLILQKNIDNIVIVFRVVLVLFFMVIFLALLVVQRKVLQPIHHLITNIRSIQKGEGMERRVFYHDEIGLLTRQFYSMKEQMDRNYQDMEVVSFTDSLTGLYNRHYFYQMAEKQIKISQRNKQHLSVLICDVDHFKSINDKHGHLIGDIALKHVADIVKSSIRDSDICARFGGEEFMVLANNTTLTAALTMAEKIRHNLESAHCVHEGITLKITISIGVAGVPQATGTKINEAIDHADKALYDAKNKGRNQVCSA